ncbi:integrase/recombinase XerD [Pseudomonas psychrotolerans]|nr:integrase/recombinase XerD [Pseudomonas psychrotolerans]
MSSERLIEEFLDALWLEKGLSPHTRSAYRTDLLAFARWLEARGLTLETVGRDAVLDHLGWRLSEGYQARSTARFLSGLRSFYKYAVRENRIAEDPTLLVSMPQLGAPLPKSLSEADVEALLAAPDTEDTLGLRDRTMLEVLYATGLRVTELVSLTLDEVNLREGSLRVFGKGSKERLIPLGEEAIAWLENYLKTARPLLLGGQPGDVLFPSQRGTVMTRQTFFGIASSCTPRWPGSAPRCRRTLSGTPSPPICSTTAPTCVRCRCCSAIPVCPPPRSTPMSPGCACNNCTPSTIRAASVVFQKFAQELASDFGF